MRVLYLSYDGMTDPLGMSQVIPYLQGLVKEGHEITLISCEKPDRYRSSGPSLSALLKESRIDWIPLPYHKKPPILAKLWDLLVLRRTALQAARRKRIELVHCRSYIPSLVGLRLKRKLGVRFVFDMRGFWADERVDGGLWNLKLPQYRLVYRYFKRMELKLIDAADRIVSLTHAGKEELLRWRISASARSRIEVIPCCADLGHFDRARVAEADRTRLATELRLAASDYVVSYLGSLGTWYMLEEMLAFFRQLLASRPEAKLLLITPDPAERVFSAARRAGVPAESLRVRAASRAEVPALLSLSRVGLFFIRPSYSKISSSPTKMAEILAMGIPVVTNSGVGDTDWLAARSGAVLAVREFGEAEYARAIAELPKLERLSPASVREVAGEHFALDAGVKSYHRIYSVCGPPQGAPA